MGQLLMRAGPATAMLALLVAARAAAQDPLPPNERGSASAPVTIVEYCAYDSDACSRLEVVITGVLSALPEAQTHFVFRHVGADASPARSLRYRAALAAGAQGAFWPMHDTLLANRERSSLADVLNMAAQLGLDAARLAADMDRPELTAAVQRDLDDAAAHGITKVPAVVVNGHAIAVADAKDLRSAIASVLGR